MFPAPLLTLLLVLSITGLPVKAANSPISVPITSRLNVSNGTYNLVAHDRARLQALMGPSKHGQRQVNAPLTNNYFVYTISVHIGNPPTTYHLVLDSGSVLTWVGAHTPYKATSSSVRTNQAVSATYYADRNMDGIIYLDTVTVGPGLTVVNQPIGVAHRSQGFVEFDGVLGIGPVALTLDTTLTLTPTVINPTVTENLVNQNIIPANILGVFFRPYAGLPAVTAGQLTFGGTDVNLRTDEITYTPITNVWPASEYWGIRQSITYGNTVILADAVGIVDSVTIFIAIATDAFQAYRAATGSQPDPAIGLLVITDNQYSALQNLHFDIGDKTFTLTRNAQIWPRAINTAIGGQSGSIYLVVRDIGTQSRQGPFDFIISYVFMQRFYTVFDAPNFRVGFSTTGFTDVSTN